MRKIIVMLSVSVDGFFAAADGSLDWGLVDDEVHRHHNAVLARMGAFLEGRVTYELMESYWPTADRVPGTPAAEVEFAGIWRDMPKIVYSRTLSETGPNATVVREVVKDEVLALKAQPGGDLVLGGPTLARAFRDHGLVDEYDLYVHPVLIGRGRRLFEADDATALRLVETHVFGNGVVRLRYQVAGG